MKQFGTQKIPKILYKYRDWKAVGTMDIITKSTIYFSSPNKFNDIFDCKITINSNLNNESHYEKLLNERIHELHDYDENNRFNPIVGKLISSKYDMPYKKRNPNEFFETYLDITTGIYSLTSDFKSNLMWGHYAANHTGICIGFKTDYLLELGADYIGSVKYTTQLPKLKPELIDHENIEKIFFTKEIDWKYENEYRLVWLNINSRIVTIVRKAINSIYLGYNIGDAKGLFVDLIKNNLQHIQLYEAVKDEKEFKLNFIKI